MTDWLESIKSASGSTVGLLAGAALAIAALLPKLLNNMASTRFDAKLLARLTEMDTKIHTTSVKVTRLVVVVTHLNGLLISNGVVVPKWLKDEIDHLTADPKEDEEKHYG